MEPITGIRKRLTAGAWRLGARAWPAARRAPGRTTRGSARRPRPAEQGERSAPQCHCAAIGPLSGYSVLGKARPVQSLTSKRWCPGGHHLSTISTKAANVLVNWACTLPTFSACGSKDCAHLEMELWSSFVLASDLLSFAARKQSFQTLAVASIAHGGMGQAALHHGLLPPPTLMSRP